MIISKKHKFIFIHVPKTAGSSIRSVLLDNYSAKKVNQHLNVKHCRRKAGDKWNEYFKFTVVRNPYSRMVSWWFHLLREERIGIKKDRINPAGSFENFLKYYKQIYKHKNLESFHVFENQFDYLNGCRELDYIIRFENLDNDFKDVCNKLGIKYIKLPHNKKWGDPDYKKYYNDELIEIIKKRFKRDLEFFKYTF